MQAFRSRSRQVVAGLLLLGLVATRVDSAEFVLEPAHTSVVFAINHLGYSYTYGRFNKVGGQLRFESDSPSAAEFAIDIDPSSVDTNDAKRDEHLRGADFFNVRQFPSMQFRSTAVRTTPEGLQLTGNFTMHGVTKQITIPLKMLGEGKGPYGKDRIGFLSQFSLKRSDFGMNNMLGPIGDDVSVLMSFEGIKQ